MRKFKRYFLLLSLILLAACSRSNNSQENSQSGRDMGVMPTTQEGGGMVQDAAGGNNLIGDKVIKTVFSSYETLAYESTIQHIQELIQRYSGYVEYSYESTYSPSGSFTPEGSNRQYRRMEYTLRIPTASLSAFLADMEGAEAVKISEQVGSQDITQTYRDTETRINVLRQKEERLNELLAQAETIDQILQIENSLSDTIAERETLQSQLDNFDDLIDYTQVHMTITERMRVSSTRGDSFPFWQRVQEAFLDSLYAFYYWLQDAAIWLIYLLPFLVVAGLLLLAFFALRRMYRRTEYAKKKTADREAALQRVQERRNRLGREAAVMREEHPSADVTQVSPEERQATTKPPATSPKDEQEK